MSNVQSTREDGGPAFPSHGSMGEVTHQGMFLRDYFAAKALPQAWAAELADLQHFNADVTDRYVSEINVARIAYRIADAMLAARQQ